MGALYAKFRQMDTASLQGAVTDAQLPPNEQVAALRHLMDQGRRSGEDARTPEIVTSMVDLYMASPEDAQAVHHAIRQTLAQREPGLAAATRILYGGSVKPHNAEALLAQADIDGALVGGASLQAECFLAIAAAS